jgi:protease-4
MKKSPWVSYALILLFLIALGVSSVQNFQPEPMASVKLPSWKPTPSVGVVVINGPISYNYSSTSFYSQTVDHVIKNLNQLRKNKAIKSLVVRINSPGGTVGASQELYAAIVAFKSENAIPVTVSVADVCASGGYWVALAGDTIFANSGSLVGSIGVIMQGLDLTEVPDKYGIDTRTYKSGKYKDLLSSWRDPTEEEEHLVQELIDDVHIQFKEYVQQRRNLTAEQVNALAMGQVFSGRQALDNGLIDTIGSFEMAVAHSKSIVGLDESAPLVYARDQSVTDWFDKLSLRFSGSSPMHWVFPQLPELH